MEFQEFSIGSIRAKGKMVMVFVEGVGRPPMRREDIESSEVEEEEETAMGERSK